MSLDADTVRVRFLPLTRISKGSLLAWRSMLDDKERERADHFYFQRDRETFIAAHMLTRAMLSEVTGAPMTSWRFVHGRYGKPELAPGHDSPPLRFNLSHTNGLVACAITYRRDLGLDVEASDRTTDLEIANQYFAPEEAALIRSVPPDQGRSLFFRFWTLKEAFIKATGEGLGRPLASFAFTLDPIRVVLHPDRDDERRDDDPAHWQFAQFGPVPDRLLALALRRPDAQDVALDIRAMQADDLLNQVGEPGIAHPEDGLI